MNEHVREEEMSVKKCFPEKGSATEERSLTLKRLVLFIVLSNVPGWIIIPLLNAHFGGRIYTLENIDSVTYATGTFFMFLPTLANLLTRLLTKEGMKDSYLAPRFQGNLRWYAASVWVVLLHSLIGAFCIWLFLGKGLTFRESFGNEVLGERTALLLLTTTWGITVFFPGFGEEFGWRGYMMPKLMSLMGKPKAILVGGVIWGVWHAPLTISGHNFGVDYPFYPWLGIFYMCALCTAINAFLTLLTEKSGSIYPASIAHMLIDTVGDTVILSLFASDALIELLSDFDPVPAFSIMLCMLPGLVILGTMSFVLLNQKSVKI